MGFHQPPLYQLLWRLPLPIRHPRISMHICEMMRYSYHRGLQPLPFGGRRLIPDCFRNVKNNFSLTSRLINFNKAVWIVSQASPRTKANSNGCLLELWIEAFTHYKHLIGKYNLKVTQYKRKKLFSKKQTNKQTNKKQTNKQKQNKTKQNNMCMT